MRILLAQLTTDGELNGSLFVELIPAGATAPESRNFHSLLSSADVPMILHQFRARSYVGGWFLHSSRLHRFCCVQL